MIDMKLPNLDSMRLKIVTGILGALFLSSCAMLNKNQVSEKNNPVQNSAVTPVSQESSTLDYVGEFLALSPEGQKKEQQQLLQSTNQSKSNMEQKIKLAISYSLPASHMRDSIKAQNLLDEILRDKSLSNNQKNLCSLLRDFNNDYTKSSTRTRDEQKRADLAQTRADMLQQKLDELKSIEKTMMIRDQGNNK